MAKQLPRGFTARDDRVVCNVCQRAWRLSPAEPLSADNWGYLVDHIRGHTPLRRRRLSFVELDELLRRSPDAREPPEA